MKKITLLAVMAMIGITFSCTKDDSNDKKEDESTRPVVMTADVTVYDDEDNLIEEYEYKGVAYFNSSEGSNAKVGLFMNSKILHIKSEVLSSPEEVFHIAVKTEEDVAAGEYASSEIEVLLTTGWSTNYETYFKNDEVDDDKIGVLNISRLSSTHVKGTFYFVLYSEAIGTGIKRKAVIENGKFEGKVSY